LTPSDESFLVVAKVKGKDSRDTLHVGALNTSELQVHCSAHANEPRRLSYGWNTRMCSYLENWLLWIKIRCICLFPNAFYRFLCHSHLPSWQFSQETWYKASGISHCWCGRERSKEDIDEFGCVFECAEHSAFLLSVCHPGDDELNKQHEMEGSVPSCKFDETFCSLIPSWFHIRHRRRR